MIIELFLIGQLLSKRVSVDIPMVVGPAKPKTIAPPRGLGLFEPLLNIIHYYIINKRAFLKK